MDLVGGKGIALVLSLMLISSCSASEKGLVQFIFLFSPSPWETSGELPLSDSGSVLHTMQCEEELAWNCAEGSGELLWCTVLPDFRQYSLLHRCPIQQSSLWTGILESTRVAGARKGSERVLAWSAFHLCNYWMQPTDIIFFKWVC